MSRLTQLPTHAALLTLLALISGLSGCEYSDCDGSSATDLIVEVDAAAAPPVISWDGDDAYAVYIEDADEQEVWRIQCMDGATSLEEAACIQGPVTYGESNHANADTENETPPRALIAGETYQAIVATLAESDSAACGDARSGEATFIAP